MNFVSSMSPFFSGLLSFLTGGISKLFTGGNLLTSMSKLGNELADLTNQNNLGNLAAKFTGSRLTDAEREANAWTASREDLAWQRQMDAANTAYQRQVADMKAAGIHPMLAAGGNGAASPSMSTAGSVSPGSGNLGDILQIMSLPKQLHLLDAQTKDINASADVKDAQAANLRESTRGAKIVNDFNQITFSARHEGVELDNKLKRVSHHQVAKSIEQMDASISLQKEQASTEANRRALLDAQTLLSKANSYQLASLLPYQQRLIEANTTEALASAKLSMVHTAYQQGLIDEGYISAFVGQAREIMRKSAAEADSAEAKATIDAIAEGVRTGKMPAKVGILANGNFWDALSAEGLLATLTCLVDNLNPLGAILK